jgi:hypothetical protein
VIIFFRLPHRTDSHVPGSVAYGVHTQNVERSKARLLAPYKNGVVNPRDFGIDVSATERVEYLFPFADVHLELSEVFRVNFIYLLNYLYSIFFFNCSFDQLSLLGRC